MNKKEYDFVNYVEQTHFLTGFVPGEEAAAKQFGVSVGVIRGLYSSESVLLSLKERGIVLKGSEGKPSDGLFTAEQIAYVRAILDPTETRPRKKILADLGLKQQTVQAWSRDPAFQSYLRDAAEKALPDAIPEAHVALTKNVMRGDVKSIQLLYEMTGRWSSKTVGELNVEFLMIKIIEVLSLHLSDSPEKLELIARDLDALSGTSETPRLGIASGE